MSQLYLELSSKRTMRRGDHIQASKPWVVSRSQDKLPIASHTEPNATSRPAAQLGTERSQDVFRKPADEAARTNNALDWETIMLDIQYQDSTKVNLESIPFLLVCRSMARIPSNVEMNAVKEELQKQGVVAEAFLLRLKGTSKDVGWNLRDMCTMLTIWRRNRSENEFDVPLQLVPCSSANTEHVADQEEIIVSDPVRSRMLTDQATSLQSPNRNIERSKSHRMKPMSAQSRRNLKRKTLSQHVPQRGDGNSLVTRCLSKDFHVDRERSPKRVKTMLPLLVSDDEILQTSISQPILIHGDNHDDSTEVKREREELLSDLDEK